MQTVIQTHPNTKPVQVVFRSAEWEKYICSMVFLTGLGVLRIWRISSFCSYCARRWKVCCWSTASWADQRFVVLFPATCKSLQFLPCIQWSRVWIGFHLDWVPSDLMSQRVKLTDLAWKEDYPTPVDTDMFLKALKPPTIGTPFEALELSGSHGRPKVLISRTSQRPWVLKPPVMVWSWRVTWVLAWSSLGRENEKNLLVWEIIYHC